MFYGDSTITVSTTTVSTTVEEQVFSLPPSCVKMPDKWAFSPGAARMHEFWNCYRSSDEVPRTASLPASGQVSELLQGFALHSHGEPLFHDGGPERFVELDGGCVPVEHLPYITSALLLHRNLSQVDE